MSVRDDVLAALDTDAPRSRASIVDDLGLDQKQVENALGRLKKSGECTRVAEGWIRASATESSPPPEVTEEQPRAKRAYKKRAQKIKAKPHRAKRKAQAAAKPINGNGALSFSLTEARMIAIERHDGSGERALIAGADAIRLCDFITSVRSVLDA